MKRALQPFNVMIAMPLGTAAASFTGSAGQNQSTCPVQNAFGGVLDSLAPRTSELHFKRFEVPIIPHLALHGDTIPGLSQFVAND